MTMRERLARQLCCGKACMLETYPNLTGVCQVSDFYGKADAVLAEIEAAGMVLVPKDELPDRGITMGEWMRTCVRALGGTSRG